MANRFVSGVYIIDDNYPLIDNGGMESWDGGTAVAPYLWTSAGAGATFEQEATIIKSGLYSAKIIRAAADATLTQNISTERGIAYWKGKSLTFKCYCYSTSTNAGVYLDDGVTLTYAFHTQTTGWDLLTINQTINAGATKVTPTLWVTSASDTAYFDEAFLSDNSDNNTQNNCYVIWGDSTNIPKMKVAAVGFTSRDTSSRATIALNNTANIVFDYVFNPTGKVGPGCVDKFVLDHMTKPIDLQKILIKQLKAGTAYLYLV